MEETSFFLTAITEAYGQSPLALTALRKHNPEGKQLYRVDFTVGPSWVMRAYHESHNLTDAFRFISSMTHSFHKRLSMEIAGPKMVSRRKRDRQL